MFDSCKIIACSMKTLPWTAERAKAYLLLFQALAEGKTIQHTHNGRLYDLQDPDFTGLPQNYRIKPPEPRVLYVNEWTDSFPVGYPTETLARERALPGAQNMERVAVRYVEAVE